MTDSDTATPHLAASSADRPLVAMITAGAANMVCGSCLHDNALARELHRAGVDARLIPVYTPIRTDETNVSIDRVFYGGINVYLDQKVPLYHRLPTALVGWLDHPAIIRWVTRRGIETDASHLGPMCVSMLRGAQGRQRREVLTLCRYLQREIRPQLISFSNVLIAGSAPLLKQQLDVPLVVTLQGDDIFLDGLPEQDRGKAIAEIAKIDAHIDRYLTHSQFYADKMSEVLGIERSKFNVVPLGVNAADLRTSHRESDDRESDDRESDDRESDDRESDDRESDDRESGAVQTENEPLTIGYLARLAPEKGLHLICDAVERLRGRASTRNVHLRVAGWLGPEHRAFAERALDRLRATNPAEAVVRYDGVIDRKQKQEFLAEIDLLCVPSPYEEPKGLYVLEALAAGVPVVAPSHGAFPELHADTGGMVLFRPGDVEHLTAVLAELLGDSTRRSTLGQNGQSAVVGRRTAKHAAAAVMAIYRELIDANQATSKDAAERI